MIWTGLLLVYLLSGAMLCGAAVEKLLLRRWVATWCVIESTSLVSVGGRPASGKVRGSPGGYRLDVAYRYVLQHQLMHPDYHEGMRAFAEKREPNWTV